MHLDDSGRFIVLVCELNGKKFTLVNIYLPNTKQLSFLKKVWKKVSTMKQGHVIMCGDFNVVPNRELDVSNQTKHSRSRSTLNGFISSSGLYDVWRCQHSSEKDYTFYSNVHHMHSRIDLFLVDKFILQQITKSDLHCITWSDHAPISVVVGDRCAETRANRWRNDIFTLSQPQNLAKSEKAIKDFFFPSMPPRWAILSRYGTHIRFTWEVCLYRWVQEQRDRDLKSWMTY